ncbi:MAG: hypothetical protein NVS1B11_24340 [Terriglobales bacterium]
MNLKNVKTVALMFLLVAICVAGRVVPHSPNFTPIAATALFAAFLFKSRVAVVVPLSAMLISDLFIGFYQWQIMLVVYAALLVPTLLGFMLGKRLTSTRLAASAVGSSAVFFLSTNFAVWAFSGMYLTSTAGLTSCYLAALPFFKYSLAGDVVWTAAMFGGYMLASRYVSHSPSRRLASVAISHS